LEKLTWDSREWALEWTNLNELLQLWKDHQGDHVVRVALQESLEKLGIVVPYGD
jgi:hypothetical protein